MTITASLLDGVSGFVLWVPQHNVLPSQWSFQANEHHVWMSFNFIMFPKFVHLTPVSFNGIHPVICSLTGIKGTRVCVTTTSTPAACAVGCESTSRQLQSHQQCGRHSTLPGLGSGALGAAGKNRSGAEFAVSDCRPWVYTSCSC